MRDAAVDVLGAELAGVREHVCARVRALGEDLRDRAQLEAVRIAARVRGKVAGELARFRDELDDVVRRMR